MALFLKSLQIISMREDSMYCRSRYLFAVFVVMIVTQANAQENLPEIVPERLQVLALEYPIAERLGVDWNEAESADVGRYMGFLAATNVVAREIADRNNRAEPSEEDYLAALAAQCTWPPNKPPIVEKYWPLQEPAFYSASVRKVLREAVGPAAVALPKFIGNEGLTAVAASGGYLPTADQEYFEKVFDVRLLSEDQ